MNEANDSANYLSLDLLEFQVLLGLISKTYFEQDMGGTGAHDSGDRAEYLEIRELSGGEYIAEMLHHLLSMLCQLVNIRSHGFEDIKNQQAFLLSS